MLFYSYFFLATDFADFASCIVYHTQNTHTHTHTHTKLFISASIKYFKIYSKIYLKKQDLTKLSTIEKDKKRILNKAANIFLSYILTIKIFKLETILELNN